MSKGGRILANKHEMSVSEQAFSDWLTRQGCPWVFIDQAQGLSAHGAKMARPRRPLHRPDFLIFLDGIGTVAVDVKAYQERKRSIVLEGNNWNEPEESFQVMYVRLSWSEIVELHEFQRVSNISTWICFYFETQDLELACLYRVDAIYDAFAPFFAAQDRGIWNEDNPAFEIFDGWKIERGPDPILNTAVDFFDFIIESETDLLINAKDAQGKCFAAVHIPPILVRLDSESQITELISIQQSEQATQAPTEAMANFARDIAVALKLNLPKTFDRLGCSNFIEKHKADFNAWKDKKKNGA